MGFIHIETIINMIFIILILVIFIGIGIRILKNKLSAVKEIEAEVIKKECFTEMTIRHSLPTSRKRFIITFMCNGKKLAFDVSEFSYSNYRVGERGILKYRGNTILDFN